MKCGAAGGSPHPAICARHSFTPSFEGSLPTIQFLQAFGAVAADFRPGDGNLHAEVAGDLFFQLLVEAAFEFPHFPATQASHVDVVSRPVRFVVVPVAAKMQQIQFINQAVFLKKINSAVNGNEVNVGVCLLRAFQYLIHIQVLFGVVHHLQNDAPLPGEPNPQPPDGLLQSAGGFGGIEAFTTGNPVRRR
jgi:hypothetical protein